MSNRQLNKSDKSGSQRSNDIDKWRQSNPDGNGQGQYSQLPYTASHMDDNDAKKRKKKKYIIGGGILLLMIVAVIIIVAVSTGGQSGGDTPTPGPTPGPKPPTPTPYNGYNPYEIETSTSIVDGFYGVLTYNEQSEEEKMSKYDNYNATGDNIGVDIQKLGMGENNQFIKKVRFKFGQSDNTRSFLSLSDHNDDNGTRFEIPEDIVSKQKEDVQYRLEAESFQWQAKPFSFSFASSKTGKSVIDTANQTFVIQDRFMQIDMRFPTKQIYGFGERMNNFQLGEGAFTMWSHGVSREEPSTEDGGKQSYGVHPFCLVRAEGVFFGIFFRNANAQSPIITYQTDGSSILSYITTGGNLDINFFFKGTAKQIIANYQNFIGRPALPPYWAMGWHSSSNGFNHDLDDFKKNIQGYTDKNIPLEGVWLDIQYMEDGVDFSVNQTTFPNMDIYTKQLQSEGKKMIVMVSPGLQNSKHGNEYIIKARESNALLLKHNSTDPFEAPLINNQTLFLDWFNEDINETWTMGLKNLHGQVPYDGLWLSMNEPSIPCSGGQPLCNGNQTKVDQEIDELREQKGYKSFNRRQRQIGVVKRRLEEKLQGQTYKGYGMSAAPSKNVSWYSGWGTEYMVNQSTFYLPFIPQRYNLDQDTIALNATHPSTGFKQIDTHSLMGHMQAKATHDALNSGFTEQLKNKRPFIMSRSTFSGSGQYAQHWIGDQTRNFQSLKHSIASVMNFNMFGIPFTGADVCGKYGDGPIWNKDQQDEICARWYQVSTFYPFARTNRDQQYGGTQIEPHLLEGRWQEMAIASIMDRYKYTRFVYGCLFEANQTGQTCFDPVFFHYPEDTMTYNDVENTFIVGNAILVAPVVDFVGKDNQYSAYFPTGNWTDLDDYSTIEVRPLIGQMKQNLTAKDTTVRKFLMQGSIIPVQMEGTINSTQVSLNSGYQLIANRDEQGHAQGKMFIDQGETVSQINDKEYQQYEFMLTNNTLQKLVLNEAGTIQETQVITKIIITNAEHLKDTDYACITSQAGRDVSALPKPVYYSNKTLEITAGLGSHFDPVSMQAIHFGTYKNGDLNLCSNHQYLINDPQRVNLSGASANLTLISKDGQAILPNLDLNISIKENGMINVKWDYANKNTSFKRPFEVPQDLVDTSMHKLSTTKVLKDFVQVQNYGSGSDSLFTIRSDQNDNKTKIFSVEGMVLGDYLNVIAGIAHTKSGDSFKGIMGLADTNDDLFLEDGVYSLWSRGKKTTRDVDKIHYTSSTGVHPFYMSKASDDTWFGVYYNLANAQDWWVKNDAENGVVNITTIAAGGLGDIWIMTGKNPNEVTQKYHELVGKPLLTPMWALGWGQSRWGYANVSQLQAVQAGYAENNLPLDIQFSDVDYMQDFKDFTYDNESYAQLPAFVNDLHNKSKKYVTILDAGIAQRTGGNYDVYNSGVAKNVFIKDSNGAEDFVGSGRAANTVYPDFFKAETVQWWQDQLTLFKSSIDFDGLWLDQNEPQNLCDGACYQDQYSKNPIRNHLTYTPTGKNLEDKSISLGAMQGDGKYIQLDTHSLYGTQETKATFEYFQKNKKRAFIIEKSSFSGMGQYGSRWLGDSKSSYKYMKLSVTGTMMQNFIGIPLSGADICGFDNNTTPELCARWHVVGAFYPFSRNHNSLYSTAQEPYVFNTTYFSGPLSYTSIMRHAMRVKYSLINYYYTEMNLIHETGGAFYKPMFFNFPDDDMAYKNQTDNVMLGNALKVSHNSHVEGQKQTTYWFPKGQWCNVFNMNTFAESCFEGGANKTFGSDVYQFDVHLREGYIVPLQNASRYNVNTTADLQNNPVDLHIHPSCNSEHICTANGTLWNDDGEVLNYNGSHNRYWFNFSMNATDPAKPSPIRLLVISTNQTLADNKTINANDKLGSIFIYNADGTKFKLNAKHDMRIFPKKGPITTLEAEYNDGSQRLQFDAPKYDKKLVDRFVFMKIKQIIWEPSSEE